MNPIPLQPISEIEDKLPGSFSSSISPYLLEQALSAATNGIVLTDCTQPDNPIIYVNPGFERMTGYLAGEVLGRNCRFLQGADTNQPGLAELREAVAAGRSATLVLRNYRKDGTPFYNELFISPVYDPQNRLIHFVGVQTDITARLEAEETRLKTEERYRKLVSGFPNGAVLLFDSELRYFLAEGSGFGQEGEGSRKALLGKTIQEIVPPQTYEILVPPYRAALQGESSTIELNFEGKYYLMHIAPLEDEVLGTSAGMVIIQDVTELKRTQAQCQQLERQLSATLESMNDGFFALDKDWRFTYLNAEAEKILACSRDKVLHQIIWERFPDMLGTSLEQAYRQVVAEQTPAHLEEYYPSRESWYEAKAYPASDGGLSVYCRDITARKEAETQLMRNEQKFRALIENSAEMITMTGSRGEVLYQSPSVAAILGYTEEELAGKNSFDFVHPDDLPHLISQHRKLVAEPRLRHQNEFRFRHRDGTWHYMETDARNLLHVPGIQAIIVNGHDVTPRKQIELALRRSEEILNFALEAARVGTWDYEVHTGRIEWSAQVEGLLGFKPGNFDQTYRMLKKRIWPSDRRILVQAVKKAPEDGLDYHLEFRLVNSDSQVSWLEWRGRSYYDRQAQSFRISGVMQDITSRKQTEAALQESEAQLRQSHKMEAVGQLAGGVAHDFNNLLTAIMGYSEIILSELNEQDPLYEDVGEILGAAQRASNLTRRLLAFSRRQVLQPGLLDLNEVVSDMNRMLRRLIGENIELVTFLGGKLAPVLADRGQLEQVIVNLAVNARDAMPGGGTLNFETCNSELTADYIRNHPDLAPGSYVQLTVRDTGHGMSETVRSRLFEPFFTTKERGRGTGLGLSMVYGIIKQSGGNIEVYSEEGHGATFKIYLPVAANGAVESTVFGRKGNVLHKPHPVCETVMLVEDEDGVRHLTARILEQYGYHVIPASHGGEALLLCERYEGKIDLLITDMVMPQLGGKELRQRLAPLQPDMEVLYMSGYTDELVLEQSTLTHSEMLHNFLHKPFSPQSLIGKVCEILDRKS